MVVLAVGTEKIAPKSPQGEDPRAGSPVVERFFLDRVHGDTRPTIVQGDKPSAGVLPDPASSREPLAYDTLPGAEMAVDIISPCDPVKCRPVH